MKYIKSKLELKLSNLGLDILPYIDKNNNGKDNPYHNNFHLKRVCQCVIKGCEYYELDLEKTKLLVISALFHDFNHSGGKFKNDDDNINLAIEGFIEWSTLSEEKNQYIIDLIKSTRFPYVTKCENLSQDQMIIRDSDVLQGVFCPDYFDKIVFALADEIGVDRSKMLVGQKDFLKSTKFCTEWATELYESVLESTLSKVDRAIESGI